MACCWMNVEDYLKKRIEVNVVVDQWYQVRVKMNAPIQNGSSFQRQRQNLLLGSWVDNPIQKEKVPTSLRKILSHNITITIAPSNFFSMALISSVL